MGRLSRSRAIRVDTVVAASPERLWADLRDIGSHVAWMTDARAIRFRSAEHEGVGTTFECVTAVGPLRLTDTMIVTEWEPPRLLGIRHVGVVTGTGRFTLEHFDPAATLITWTEELVFPWWMGGRAGALIGGVVLGAIWRRNLANLAARHPPGAPDPGAADAAGGQSPET